MASRAVGLRRLVVVVTAGAAAAGAAGLATATGPAPAIALRLEADRLDHFLPAPPRRTVRLALDARNAPPKTRVMFIAPLPAGRHRYEIDVRGGRADRTLTIATPVRPGRSTFDVTVSGAGRVDLGFWSAGPTPREYRFTVHAPVNGERFDVDLPAM
jgi:hypothetical protein